MNILNFILLYFQIIFKRRKSKQVKLKYIQIITEYAVHELQINLLVVNYPIRKHRAGIMTQIE